MHDQFDKTRLEKIALVCEGYKKYNVNKPFLKICSVEKKFDSNCCACRKCISTAMGFYALNKNAQEYGVNLTIAQATQKSYELLAPKKLNYYTILYFKEVQQALRKRLNQKEKLPEELLQLLTIDLDTKIPYDILDQHKLDWDEMKKVLPHDYPQPEPVSKYLRGFLEKALPNSNNNLIEEIRFPKKNRMEVRINKAFKDAYLRDNFFVEYEDEDIDLTKLDYTIVTVPFLMNVMSLVWVSGKDYYIEAMDQELYDSLERIKTLFKLWYPCTEWNGRLIPHSFVSKRKITGALSLVDKAAPSGNVEQYDKTTLATADAVGAHNHDKIAILFSGGVDSLTCSYKNREKKQLLITAWGQSCLPLDHPEIWYPIKEQLIDFAQRNGHENSFIRSNYYYFLNFKKLSTLSPDILSWRIETIEDIGWAGLTAPILVSKGISRLHIGSSDSVHRLYASCCNPYIDGNIRFAGLQFIHDQFGLTRHDKIACISDLCSKNLITKPELIICQQPGNVINCGSCEKCCATLLSLLALEQDPRDYGYAITPQQSMKQCKKALENREAGSGLVWQVEDIQKSGLAKRNKLYDLSWLNEIDVTTYQPYDLEKTELLDIDLLKELFPDIELHT